MVLLRAVENILDDLEPWPTYVIYNMLVVVPNEISVKKVAAFMYGNGVPVERAIDCFNACMVLDSYYVSCIGTLYGIKSLSRLIKRSIIPCL